jgi:hypothetical protein
MTNEQKKTLLYVGGGIAAYFLIIKPLLIKIGLQPSQQDIQQAQNVQNYIQNAVTTQSPTKSEGEWQIIANQIFEDLKYSAVSDNKGDAVYQLARAKNNADVALLIKTFGKRQETWFGIIPSGGDKDLQQFVTDNLSDTQIATVNDNYRRKNIQYQF